MKKLASLGFSLVLLGACASSRPMASATLAPTSGNTAAGTVKLTQLKDGSVQVKADLTGVPEGVHGFHIHQNGDCGDNGNAAGPHFNPTSMPHAAPDAASHHSGDWGNVTADASGAVHTMFTTHSITLGTGETNAVGHSIILHANPDDLTTQPSGNAGARISCGIVTMNP